MDVTSARRGIRSQKETDYDPQSAAIGAAFTAAFLDYYHGKLKFGQGDLQRHQLRIGEKWTLDPQDRSRRPVRSVNTGVDLAEALVKDANLKVLVLNGYYDLATPFSATEYVMTHLGCRPQVRGHSMKYYEAGHMMYVHPPSAAKMKRDLDAFIDATDRL